MTSAPPLPAFPRATRAVLAALALCMAAAASAGCAREQWEPQPLPWPADAITTITVLRADGNITLSRQAGAWTLSEPITAPVSDTMAERLTALVEQPLDVDLRRERRLTAEALDIESTDIRVVLHAGDESLELLLGRSGHRVSQVPTTWVAAAEGDTVYRARVDLRALFDREPSAFRSRRVVDLDRDRVHTVTFIDEASSFIVRRQGEDWRAEDGTPIDQAAVRRLVLSLARLNATRVSTVDQRDAGLLAPRFAVRLATDDETATVYLGDATADGMWFAMREGSPTIFELSRVAARFVDTRQADLASPFALELLPEDVARIDGERSWTRLPCDEDCEAGAPRQYEPADEAPVTDAERQALESMLQAVAALRVVRWLDPPPVEPPTTALTLTLDSAASVTIAIGPPIGDDGSPLDVDDHIARLNQDRWFRISHRHAASILALAAPTTTPERGANAPTPSAQTE